MLNKKSVLILSIILSALLTTISFSQNDAPKKTKKEATNDEDKWTTEGRTPEMIALHKMFRQRYLERFEKDGIGKPENVANYIGIYKSINILDKKIWHCEISGKAEDGKIIISGDVNANEFKTGIERALKELGFNEIENNIIVLPDDTLPDTPYAFCAVSAAWMFREADLKSEPLNQVLYGETVRLLKKSADGEFYFIQSPDAYLGWTPKENIIPITVDKYKEYQNNHIRAIFSKNSQIIPDGGKSEPVKIFTNTMLPLSGTPSLFRKIKVKLPDGGTADVNPGEVKIINPNIRAQGESLKKLALEVMGSDYKWGGITKEGIDCSGYSQYLYKRIGINLPRDADEQAGMGKIVAYNDSLTGLLPGDLLFFIGRSGRIGHVAISLGGTEFVHASGKNVHFGSLDRNSPNYLEKAEGSVFFVKRILAEGFKVNE